MQIWDVSRQTPKPRLLHWFAPLKPLSPLSINAVTLRVCFRSGLLAVDDGTTRLSMFSLFGADQESDVKIVKDSETAPFVQSARVFAGPTTLAHFDFVEVPQAADGKEGKDAKDTQQQTAETKDTDREDKDRKDKEAEAKDKEPKSIQALSPARLLAVYLNGAVRAWDPLSTSDEPILKAFDNEPVPPS